MSTKIAISKIFPSVANSDFPYNVDQKLVKTSGNKTTVLVDASLISDSEKVNFNKLLEALEIPVESVTNYGFASYLDEQFANHAPIFCGLNTDGKVALKIGADSDTHNTTSIWVEMQTRKVSKQFGKKLLEVDEYHFNGCKVDLRKVDVKDSTGKVVKDTLEFIINYTDENRDDFEFVIPVLFDRKQFETNQQIVDEYKRDNLAATIRAFSSGGSNVWLAANKIFSQAFTAKTFPKDGVFFVLKNGRLKHTPAGKIAGIEHDMMSAEWDIVTTSHPEMMVVKNHKTAENCTLSEGTILQFSSAAQNNEGYKFLIDAGVGLGDSYDGNVLVKFIGQAKNPNHMPNNIATNNPIRVERLLGAKYNFLAKNFDLTPLPFADDDDLDGDFLRGKRTSSTVKPVDLREGDVHMFDSDDVDFATRIDEINSLEGDVNLFDGLDNGGVARNLSDAEIDRVFDMEKKNSIDELKKQTSTIPDDYEF